MGFRPYRRQSGSRRAFSLIELIVVIAVMAALIAILAWRIYGVSTAAKLTAETQNINLWNSSYQNVVASGYKTGEGALFSTLDWSHASALLDAGVEITSGSSTFQIQVDTPTFRFSGEPDFTPGKGITAPPTEP